MTVHAHLSVIYPLEVTTSIKVAYVILLWIFITYVCKHMYII